MGLVLYPNQGEILQNHGKLDCPFQL